jgi:8-oxo-dGTP diphosphatase
MNGKLRNMTAIYLLKGDKVLLLFRNGGKIADQLWTGSAGGHFEEYELNDATACVLREMKEELDIGAADIENLSLRYVTLRNTRGEIRQNYYFFATLSDQLSKDLQSNEGTLRWFPLNEVHRLEMPFTAKFVIEHYRKEGRFTKERYVGVTTAEGVSFLPLPKS